VFPDSDPSPDAAADSPTLLGEPARGPDGRFLAAPSAAGEPASGRSEPPKPAADKIKFAGEEWDSNDAIEQNFKSLRGTFKPVAGLARHLGGMDRIVPKFTEAAESARGWKAEHDRVKAELDAIRTGATPATPAADPAAAEADSIDWELYAEVQKLAADSGEPWKAEQWLIEQVRKADRAHVTKLLDERFAPLTAAQAKMQTAAKTEALFESLTQYTNDDGSPAFPELNDESAAYEIGRTWASLGLPAEAALSAQGAIAAIAVYRMRRPQAGPSLLPTTPTPPPSPATPTDTRSAAGLDDGRPSSASVPGNGATPSAEAARILAGLRSVNQGNRAHLGFDP
jgi:hypothetical protein